jgi:hypothetical protein
MANMGRNRTKKSEYRTKEKDKNEKKEERKRGVQKH